MGKGADEGPPFWGIYLSFLFFFRMYLTIYSKCRRLALRTSAYDIIGYGNRLYKDYKISHAIYNSLKAAANDYFHY